MPDLEPREDDWARGVFDRVRTGQHEPRWHPDAEAAARLSGRHRTRVRASGALAALAVVGLSATAFGTLGGNASHGRSTLAPPTTGTPPTTPATPTTPSTSATTRHDVDITKYLAISPEWSSTSGNGTTNGTLSPVGVATINTVLQRLDPTLGHIRTQTSPHKLDTGPEPPGVTNAEIYAGGFWAPKGDISSFPKPGTSFVPTTPFGYVSITPMGPDVGQQVNVKNKPCGLASVVNSSQVPKPTTWSPCIQSPQSDGSSIEVTHSLNLPAGVVTVAARVFPDHSSVQILVSTVIGEQDMPPAFVAGPSLDPVPWTDDSLVRALTGPDVKGLP